MEKYYGTFTQDSVWYWASAGKSLTAFLVGLAQEQGYLNINDSLPKYLGHGFSSCNASAEDSIRIIHQLTMTTGFDDDYAGVPDNECTLNSCLVCLAPPGTRWAYHNAPYTILHRIIDSATGMSINAFKTANLATQTGITGQFIPVNFNDIYYSKARSFARFGLLISNHGIWDTDTIMHNTGYFNDMVNTSQNINLSYGYLWWLNGKASYHLPQLQFQFNGPLVPDAPADMYAALGKNNQILNIVPSLGLVMIRMGNSTDPNSPEVSNQADDSIWVRLNAAICSTLAISMLDFNGVADNSKTQLHWSTASESNNDYFTVERSQDAVHFSILGKVNGAGNSAAVLHYSFADLQPLTGLNYYRIVQTDFNGATSLSKTIMIKYSKDKTNAIKLFPNPANTFIQLSSPQPLSKFNIDIINSTGEIVLQTSNQVNIDISRLHPGVYFLKLKSDDLVSVTKFQKSNL